MTTTALTEAEAVAVLRAAGAPDGTAAQLATGLAEAPFPEPYATYGGVTLTLTADGARYQARPTLAGPLCESHGHVPYCQHASCNATAAEQPWTGWCDEHGYQHVDDAGSGSGFAGGRVYWTDLACGCTQVDETGDVAAAR
jgi:hypothetical protein